jgi:hypothetical protein
MWHPRPAARKKPIKWATVAVVFSVFHAPAIVGYLEEGPLYISATNSSSVATRNRLHLPHSHSGVAPKTPFDLFSHQPPSKCCQLVMPIRVRARLCERQMWRPVGNWVDTDLDSNQANCKQCVLGSLLEPIRRGRANISEMRNIFYTQRLSMRQRWRRWRMCILQRWEPMS